MNRTEQAQLQVEKFNELKARAALLSIKVDLLTAEYEAAQEREKAVYNAALQEKAFYYAEDICGHKKGERIADRLLIGAASTEQLDEFYMLVSAKYAELYDLHYAPNYCPTGEYFKPLFEARQEFRQIAVDILRLHGQTEKADELEQALHGYISPTIAEKLDNITRQFIAAKLPHSA